MRKILIGIFFSFLFVSVLSLSAYAQMCRCMDGHDGDMRCGMMQGREHQGMGMMGGMMMGDDHPMAEHFADLGLDEKQKEALKALRSRMMKEMVKKRADVQLAGIELKDLLDKDPVDMKAVETAAKKRDSLKTEMFLAQVKAHEEMKSLLTADQKKRLKEMMGSHGAGCTMMGGAEEHKDMPMSEHMH